jgi:hypothetical protein
VLIEINSGPTFLTMRNQQRIAAIEEEEEKMRK